MASSNIERFDEIAGKAFGLLYESFPVPRNIMIRHLTQKDSAINENDFTEEEGYFIIASLQWLINSGYITAARPGSIMGFSDVVLTAKSLEVMKAIPDSLQTPLGERLVEAAKGEGRELFRSLVGQVLDMGLKYTLGSGG
jgi:hypothetical protein